MDPWLIWIIAAVVLSVPSAATENGADALTLPPIASLPSAASLSHSLLVDPTTMLPAVTVPRSAVMALSVVVLIFDAAMLLAVILPPSMVVVLLLMSAAASPPKDPPVTTTLPLM